MLENIESVETGTVCGASASRSRSTARYRCHVATPARLFAEELSTSRISWVYNLSADGLGLLLGEPLDPSTTLELELITPTGRRIATSGRVAHATRRPDGNWLIGCELFRPLLPQEIEALR